MMEIFNSIKKIIILIIVGLVFASSLSICVYAAERSGSSSSGIISEEKKGESKKLKEIEKNKLNYDLDKENKLGVDDVGGTAGHFFSSIFFKASRGMGYLSAYLTKFSIDFDLFSSCKKVLEKPFASLKSFTLKEFKSQIGLLFIALTLALVIFLIIKGQTAAGMGKLVQIIVVLLIAMFFFIEPLNYLSSANTLAKDFGMSVFEYVQDDKTKATDAAVSTVWGTMAENPWLLLEFDDMSNGMKSKAFDKKDTKEYELFHSSDEDKREDIANDLADTYRPLRSSSSAQTDRLGTAVLMLLMNLVVFLILLAITVLILGLQALSLILGLLAPMVFIVALFPNKGVGLLKNWGAALLLGYIGIALSLFGFGIFLLLLNLVYGTLIKELGIFLSFVIIMSMIIVVIFFRRRILGIFGDSSSLDRFESRAERSIMRRYMHHGNPRDSLVTRAGRTAGHKIEQGVESIGGKVKNSYGETEFGKNRAAHKQAERQDEKARRQDWVDDVKARADDKREYYSQREQEKASQQQANANTKKINPNDEVSSNESKPKPNIQTKPGNVRDQVREQQKENTGWKRDEKGIPYKADSEVGQSHRQQAKSENKNSKISPSQVPSQQVEGVRHSGSHSDFNLYNEQPGEKVAESINTSSRPPNIVSEVTNKGDVRPERNGSEIRNQRKNPQIQKKAPKKNVNKKGQISRPTPKRRK